MTSKHILHADFELGHKLHPKLGTFPALTSHRNSSSWWAFQYQPVLEAELQSLALKVNLTGLKAVGLERLQSQSQGSCLDAQPLQVHIHSQLLRFTPVSLFPSISLSQKSENKAKELWEEPRLQKTKKNQEDISFYTDLSVIVDCVPLIGAFGKKSYYPIYIVLLLREY